MEIRLDPAKLDVCIDQLSKCEKMLTRKRNELLEISEKLRGIGNEEMTGIVSRRLGRELEQIQKQCSHLGEMKKVLRKVKKMYERCEEDILQVNVSGVRQYAENPRVVHLKKIESFQITLK